jgi:hypothetical protein
LFFAENETVTAFHVIHVVCAIYTITDKCIIYDSVCHTFLALVRTGSGSHGREPFIGKIEVIFGLFVDIVGVFDFRYTERRHDVDADSTRDIMESILQLKNTSLDAKYFLLLFFVFMQR